MGRWSGWIGVAPVWGLSWRVRSMGREIGGEPGELASGQRIAGRYVVESLLGRGAMGAVYAALDLEIEERVALKLLPSSSTVDLQRFKREVRLARRVTSRHVARTHDLGLDGDQWFLTMQMIEGEDLQAKLERDPAPPLEVAVSLGTDIATGLAVAHAAGVVHRDLKPANVLVDLDGRAVLTDFGIAVVAAEAEGTARIGTPAFMAPEQIHNEGVEPRSDVYALGLILWSMLCGRRAWPRGNAGLMQRLHLPPPDPRSHAPVDDALADLVVRMLATHVGDRPDAAEVRDHLEDHGSLERSSSQRLPTASARRTLAVLPPRWRGPASEGWLAESLQEGVIDRLCRCRGGLRVLSAGAVQSLGPRPTPTELRNIGAHFAVETTATCHQGAVTIVARLVLCADGTQLWSDRFAGILDEWLALEDSLAGQIAEALRTEISLDPGGAVPASAVQAYLAARRALRGPGFRHDDVVPMLDQAVRDAPSFAAAHAMRALTLSRARWLVQGDPEAAETRAQVALDEAIRAAPDHPETWLAAADHHLMREDFVEAMQAVRRALEIAPSFAPALHWLALVECETGRQARGRVRLAEVIALDPAHSMTQIELARQDALEGDHDACVDRLRDMVGLQPAATILRSASWWKSADETARLAAAYLAEKGAGWDEERPRLYLRSLARTLDGEGLARHLGELDPVFHPRWRALANQLACESFLWLGRPDLAEAHLRAAGDALLLDLVWLDRCPLLEPLRDTAVFEDVRRRVRVRGVLLWS